MKEGWKQIKLGDIIHIKHGYGFKGEYFVEEPNENILVTPGNFAIGGGFKNDKMKYYDGPINEEFVLSEGDVIVTMTDLSKQADTLGYSAKVPKDDHHTYLHNQRIGLISMLTDDYELEYIYWLLRTHSYQRYIAGSSSGATVKHTSPKKIYSCKLVVPKSKDTQRKIGSILSAYDDLIENNLKRIKLLEEQAQQTYEDWFVRLKFPGHEIAVFDEESGLPVGWDNLKLVECANLVMGQSPKSEFYNNEEIGLPFHQGVKDYGFRFPTNSSWTTQGNRMAEEDSILFSVRAPVGRLNVAIEKLIIGRGLASINHKKGWNSFLLYQLQNIFYEDNLMGGGAIYNSVTKKDVETIKIIHASEIINIKFNDFASNCDELIKNLTQQNQLLKEARDILLPRLMSGMIDVESLEINPGLGPDIYREVAEKKVNIKTN